METFYAQVNIADIFMLSSKLPSNKKFSDWPSPVISWTLPTYSASSVECGGWCNWRLQSAEAPMHQTTQAWKFCRRIRFQRVVQLQLGPHNSKRKPRLPSKQDITLEEHSLGAKSQPAGGESWGLEEEEEAATNSRGQHIRWLWRAVASIFECSGIMAAVVSRELMAIRFHWLRVG